MTRPSDSLDDRPYDRPYDSIVLISFGGPEGPDDVIPFLENVTRGREIPRERLAIVGEHYGLFGGISPINQQNRDLLAALRAGLDAREIDLPLFWGNRNWHPLLEDTAADMAAAGHRRAIGIVTSAFGSYSGCRQYREDIERATGETALHIDKARLYWNHPGFLDAMADRMHEGLTTLGSSADQARIVFTAHSIPSAWVDTSPYLDQLRTAARHLAERCAPGHPWDLAFQSRSGPPHVPWLEPDINDHLRSLHADGVETVLVVPLGFVSDHMEVVYDLDVEAAATAEELGLSMARAATAGTHPGFVRTLVDLVVELLSGTPPQSAVGDPWPRKCPPGCCALGGSPGSV